MKFGIYHVYWGRQWNDPFEVTCEKCRKASRMGFDVLEVNAVDLAALDAAKLADLRSLASDCGIRLTAGSGLTPQRNVASENPEIRRAGIEYLKRTFECLDRAGVHKLAGMMYSCWPETAVRKGTTKEAHRERSILSLREIADAAADHGVQLMLEVANRFECFLLNTSEEATAYVKEVGKQNVFVMLDSFHMNIEEDHIGDAIRTAGRYLGHLHIGESNRKVPGKGHIPWKEIGQGLRDIDFSGDVVMEPFVLHNCPVGDDIGVWRDLSDGADEARLDSDLEESLRFLKKEFGVSSL
ncbi:MULTISPECIES: D-psicose 3-epimerase [Anaerotruncus]|uniref:D-psicose 3-epimerase n=3 Tax=Oscillospiraceae TaxID=216572 RepID=UPI000833E85A|nr:MULTISPECIES: sugar phosphate isomerase/epimerase [Anaerotruncus]RGX54963.1 sugar phosphate isomerase/epimerase [Anaerotruncus sp. AF02-27]